MELGAEGLKGGAGGLISNFGILKYGFASEHKGGGKGLEVARRQKNRESGCEGGKE